MQDAPAPPDLPTAADLHGFVVVVSGSAVGIGRAIATTFGELGARIVGLDIDAAGNAETKSAVEQVGSTMEALTVDVGDAAAVGAAIDGLDRVDVVVNNAAVWNDTTLTGGDYETQTSALRRALDAGAIGTFNVTAACVPLLRAAPSALGSNIVTMITEHIRSHRLITGLPATGYDAAKFAQWRFTESWAKELLPFGVRVNALAFGATDTPMLRAVSERAAENGMRAEDMAGAVLNIVRQGSDGPTGVTYDVGFSGTPRTESLQQIAAIATTRRTPTVTT
jgi:NAD(P)-dependent dehydrogenase (short-subunit alcohol dehydrogenase family)